MADSHNSSHKVNYTAIFFALCICTGASVIADLGKNNMGRSLMIGVVMGIACIKATFVLLYFMHIKFESAWKYILLAPTVVLALALPLALSPDIGFHYYLVQVPQVDVPLQHGEGGHGHGASDHGTAEHGEAKDAHGKDHAPAKSEEKH